MFKVVDEPMHFLQFCSFLLSWVSWLGNLVCKLSLPLLTDLLGILPTFFFGLYQFNTVFAKHFQSQKNGEKNYFVDSNMLISSWIYVKPCRLLCYVYWHHRNKIKIHSSCLVNSGPKSLLPFRRRWLPLRLMGLGCLHYRVPNCFLAG